MLTFTSVWDMSIKLRWVLVLATTVGYTSVNMNVYFVLFYRLLTVNKTVGQSHLKNGILYPSDILTNILVPFVGFSNNMQLARESDIIIIIIFSNIIIIIIRGNDVSPIQNEMDFWCVKLFVFVILILVWGEKRK